MPDTGSSASPPTDRVHGARRRSALSAIAALLFLGSVVAVLAGPFTPRGTQPPIAHPIQSPGYMGCRSCHGGYHAGAATVEPYDTWAGSMMANAARDPLFWAALDVANNDVPGIGDFCLRCHVPTGWYAGRSEPPGGTVDGCGLIDPIDQPENDFEGITCHFCHRAMVNATPPPGEAPFYTQNNQAWLDDGDCGGAGEPCRRGPFDYPIGGPDLPPDHPWAFSPYHLDANICGLCHNVTSPAKTLIDETGADTGIPYPIERTFKEWQQSAYAPSGSTPKTCQQCHMPIAIDASAPIYACIYEQNRREGELKLHQFVGGNTWVPAVLKAEYGTALGRTEPYDDTVAWASETLHQAAEVALTAPPTAEPGQPFGIGVRVTNQSGHKLPSGYTEGRRLWLQVRLMDAANNVLVASGAYDPATGVLTEDAQVKIYRSEPGIWNLHGTDECDVTSGAGGAGDPIFHFALNDCIRLDNRIPPRGFAGGDDLETRPVGYSYPETSPGSGVLVHYDDTSYQVTVPAGFRSPVTVEARLLYQVVSKEYVEFLRDEAVTNGFPDDCIERVSGPMASSRGEILHDLWVEHGRAAPFEMDVASAQVVVGRVFRGDFETGDTSQWSSTSP